MVGVPLIFNDLVYFVNGNDTVYAIVAHDGTSRWRWPAQPSGGISPVRHAGISRRENRVFAAFSDGNVVALDANDGSVIWAQDTSQDIENIEESNEAHTPIDVDTTPLVIGDTVYAASYTAGVYAFDVVGGTRRWRLDNVRNVSVLSTDGTALYAASATSGLVKIDAFDGSVEWARDLGTTSLMAVVPAGTGILAVTSADLGLWMVRESDGVVLDGLRPGTGFSSAPTISGNQIYLQSNGSVLYADIRTAVRWSRGCNVVGQR